MKKIRIVYELKKQIAKEMSVTTQTVEMALAYVYNSEVQQNIRQRAKELLQQEADKVQVDLKTNSNN
ncbi:hypothetical protein [Capnocytophaga sp. oral taxon 326]|jgi:hypothetical protein|uniref:hypothetical protein n=1 Tax=Capnocytophaga sp. oral taxon 326 TaxID=712212 RepID=UPI0002A1C21B|nr:hypothetical protein [Capnocytophaga sp. oral taxon 326]EKY17903.1 hypothetical protein HMPREF9073_01319 [Capnocytophaga sp. oral taxon 326 str. F0382]DAI47729.1 MAG TPA: Transcriptional regulators GENOMICS, PSI-2, SUGAR BINDING [Caudoviricetes sp.]